MYMIADMQPSTLKAQSSQLILLRYEPFYCKRPRYLTIITLTHLYYVFVSRTVIARSPSTKAYRIIPFSSLYLLFETAVFPLLVCIATAYSPAPSLGFPSLSTSQNPVDER
jgi:hypothetical protein